MTIRLLVIISIGALKMKNKIHKKPINGSLIVALLATILAPFLSLNSFRFGILPFATDDRWINISNSLLHTYNPEWVKLVYFEFCSNIFLFLYTIFLLVSFILRKKYYSKVIIFYFVLKIILLALIYYFQTVIKGPPTPTLSQISGVGFRSLIFTGIWVPYFLLSEKVRETFIY